MNKLLQVLVFAIVSNCLFAQNGYLDLRQRDSLAKGFSNNPKMLNNAQLIKKNKDFKPDKSLKWEWDTILAYDTVGLIQRYTQTFDSRGNVLTQLTENRQNNAWVNHALNKYTYDSKGNMLTNLSELWQSNNWVTNMRWTYTYDGTGNMLTYLWEIYQNSKWVNNQTDTIIYNTNGKMQTEIIDQWQDSVWAKSEKDSCTYDANGNRLTYLYKMWQNNSWVNVILNTYTYDGNGNMLINLSEIWQSNNWENSTVDSLTYDGAGDMLTDINEYWQSNAWTRHNSYTYTYDGTGNMLTETFEQWQSPAWVNNSLYTYTYDGNGNAITGKYEFWKNNKWIAFSASDLYVYSQKNQIEELNYIYRYEAHWVSFPTSITNFSKVSNFGKVDIYPNPANQQTKVSYQLPENSSVNINIYNIMGREVEEVVINESQEAGEHVVKVNTQQFEDGVYVLKFVSNGIIETRKVVVQH